MNLLIALSPLFIIFICLFIFNYSALKTGIITFIFIIMITLSHSPYHISLNEVIDSSISGVLISTIAAYVIFFGILLFHLMNESGKVDAISNEIKRLTENQVLQVIILVIGISPLIESTSGFGTAFLVITPILISLGINSYKAACIGILSLLAVPWGALATGTVIGTELVNMKLRYVGFLTAILTFPTIIYFLGICIYILGGIVLVKKNINIILIYSSAFSITNVLFNYFVSVELAGVFSSLLTLLIGVLNIKIQNRSTHKNYNQLVKLLSPYILLTILVLLTRTVPILEHFFKSNLVISINKYDYQLLLLYSPGFWLILSCIYTILYFKTTKTVIINSIKKTFKQWGVFVLSTTLFISLAEIMDTSGMIITISNAIGTNIGSYFIVVSSIIGSMGGFLTGSNTGANAMFIKLQVHTADQLNISTKLIAGLQNASASNATMSTPSRIMLASELCEIKEKETILQAHIFKIIIFSVLLLIISSCILKLFI
ncbi:L-lactate permease [Macrococcus capreoli]|uniref:L-lactate permease n=1 Tax=Macrococcus capreoli TaxID=2982690 RepID=UPI003EE66E16